MNHLLTELQQYRQWVCHDSAKVPLNPRTGKSASVANPADWSGYEEAVAAVDGNHSVGIGFVLTAADPFVVIDLDTHKTTDPNIHSFHNEIFKSFDSYCELSPSGKGAHIWLKGSIPTVRKSSESHVEIYSHARYITVTGKPINNMPVAEANGNLHKLWADLGGDSNAVPTDIVSQPQTRSDDDVCRQAADASNGEQFKALYFGHWQAKYPSQSEADQAFCNIIAFYSPNAEQVVRIFHASALGQRAKAKRKDYVGRLIAKAFDRPITDAARDVAQLFAPTKPQIQNVPLQQPQQTTKRKVEILNMENAQPSAIEWLWDGFLPKGMLALLAGAPGTGKSTLAFSFAATISRGGKWPDDTQCPQGKVFIWSGEDNANKTIIPRLLAMNAYGPNIRFLTSTTDDRGNRFPFNPATDIPLLRETVQENGGSASLLIIDPIVSAVTGDMNKANEVRRGLQQIVDFAEEFNCTVLGITHFTKGSQGRNPAERVLGSQAFGAFARVVLVAAQDEESDKRVLVRAKSNISKDSGGFYYAIQTQFLPTGITTCIDWGGAIEGSSRDILAEVEHQDNPQTETRTTTNEAQAFLLDELKDGPRFAGELIAIAEKQLGIKERTLQRARKKLGIVTVNEGFQKGWRWSLPLPNPFSPIQQSGSR